MESLNCNMYGQTSKVSSDCLMHDTSFKLIELQSAFLLPLLFLKRLQIQLLPICQIALEAAVPQHRFCPLRLSSTFRGSAKCNAAPRLFPGCSQRSSLSWAARTS